MWIGIAILEYFVGVLMLIRFMQAVHSWDNEIEEMEYWKQANKKRSVANYRPAP